MIPEGPAPEAGRPARAAPRRAPLAILLLSGGLDSATAGAWACRRKGFRLAALTVAYGQRHRAEIAAAGRVARMLEVERHIQIRVDLDRIGGSALTDRRISVPKQRSLRQLATGIPLTYVPARNTVFLALALGLAESLGSTDLIIGVNALDYSGYPDCRPAFLRSFSRLAMLATREGVEGRRHYRIHTPLLHRTKAQIIRLGLRLGVDYAVTHSCYDPLRRGKRILACGTCDSCLLRLKGFQEAGRKDPIAYLEPKRYTRAVTSHRARPVRVALSRLPRRGPAATTALRRPSRPDPGANRPSPDRSGPARR